MDYEWIRGANYVVFRNGMILGRNGVPLVHIVDKDGYECVNLYNPNKKGMRMRKVHRILAEAFIPNPDNLPCVDHINRIRSDNRLENLRWVNHLTNSQNRVGGKPWFNKNTNRWRCSFTMNGTLYQKTFITEQEAKDWLAQKRRELNHPLQ